ncbi:uncharacterized protein C10orf62 homolog [Dromiciops gliroides]|uniref:uncharacterized protein C10orf62 homolog n=1 Tax=Dromiciops gliroides TaxID=33562 RepID=UPI001CC72551|nr:uncharacterized protein C10orf62 homolog [Dromiciops gliroides]
MIFSGQEELALVLESLRVLTQPPSCKVVLAVSLLLGAGGLYLWFQWKKKSIKAKKDCRTESVASTAIGNKSDPWIKSHFSRLSDEKLCALLQDCGSGEASSASTNVQVETCTSRVKEGKSPDIHKESYISRQRTSGSKVFKNSHRESSKSTSADESTWASVAACVREIDITGRHLADSMLQRATEYQNSGHLESKDINKEELKALEEVEMKVKGNFLTHRENNVAGSCSGYHTHGNHSQPPRGCQLGRQNIWIFYSA